MDQAAGQFLFSGVGIFVFAFLILLAILWFCLPFAIFGTKDLLKQLIAENQRTNTELESLRSELNELKNSPNCLESIRATD